MMIFGKTYLKKLMVRLEDTGTVTYQLNMNEPNPKTLLLNDLLGKSVQFKFTKRLQCTACQVSVKKIYQQGYCFPCTQKLAACDLCIVKPERCHFHLGTCREPDWAVNHCFSPHIIYLANTSGLKVGITRETQIPTRWIDQGAISAIPLFRVNSRYHAGLIETIIATHLADKTDWRKMLKNEVMDWDLWEKRKSLKLQDFLRDKMPKEILEIDLTFLDNVQPTRIHYPILETPKKIVSLNLEKTPIISGILLGIKGQYLIFDCGVLNIRNHTGYEVEIS